MAWTVADLFSGVGGMSAGFASRPDAFELVAAVDAQRAKPGRGRSAGSSSLCNASYALNHGIEPLDLDLATLDAGALPELLGVAPGGLDVLIACPPCTGFSQKVAHNHLRDDARNSLVARIAGFVAALRPRVLVMENVKELVTGRHRHHFDVLARDLAALGYDVRSEVSDLARHGLPQRRVRALVVATAPGVETTLDLPVPARPATVRDAIGHLPPLRAGETDPGDPQHICPAHTPAVLERIRATPADGGSWSDVARTRPDLLVPSMLRRKKPGSFPDVYGRTAWDAPAPTITRECGHPGNGRYLHPEQDRMLSVREMALLQGFPPGFAFAGPLAARYNQIGDAVPPLIARHIAACVAEALGAADGQPASLALTA